MSDLSGAVSYLTSKVHKLSIEIFLRPNTNLFEARVTAKTQITATAAVAPPIMAAVGTDEVLDGSSSFCATDSTKLNYS